MCLDVFHGIHWHLRELLLKIGGVQVMCEVLTRIKWGRDETFVESDPINCGEERMTEDIIRGARSKTTCWIFVEDELRRRRQSMKKE